jgi:hypothetical protein
MLTSAVLAQKPARPVLPLIQASDGKIVYQSDERGNRIPDYSYCGYQTSEKPIPFVAAKVVVTPVPGDATSRIQAALDYVAGLPVNPDGFRGAVLLSKGRFTVEGSLRLKASGVVLRGSGMGEEGTVLVAAGTDRETLIRVVGGDKILGKGTAVTDNYLPVNTLSLTVQGGSFRVGDRIRIRRPSTWEWIRATGTESFGGAESAIGWKPGNQDICWDRTVQSVQGDRLLLDAPLTTDMDRTYAVDTVYPVQWPGKLSNVGIENLQLVSEYDTRYPKDENHRWMAITLENAENCWVRRVAFRYFAGSAVYALETASRLTVEDCKSFQPVSEIGGYRRNTFLNDGQLNLFQRCWAELGYHDFGLGQCAAGPNAFVQCFSSLPYSFSGTLGSWNSGVLFDNVRVDGNALNLSNRRQDGQGAGWSAANSMLWQCKAAVMDCPRPPMAQNWAFGNWCQFQGDGFWTASSESVNPQSLFYGQLKDRLGYLPAWAGLMPEKGEASSSPSYEVAAQLSREARQPGLTYDAWIDTMVARSPLSLESAQARNLDQLKLPAAKPLPKAAAMSVTNGWIVRGDQPVLGLRRGVNWWNGNVKNNFLNGTVCLPHLTRWVPGRTGKGLTDDLDQLTDQMRTDRFVATDHNYALWYERRRDDHIHERRMDGDVWAPLYELPFARSGQGTAYDGLSKYDLTRWNSWYWKRLKTYADLADQKGLVLFNQNFFQHNIIEAGAHWADCPWRTANNINGTGFPEPVNFAGDKRIFFAEQFYDLSNTTRKALYRNYIRQCLENYRSNSGVIQFIGHEYTGPKAFVEFWLDVIGEWERETGLNALVCLSTTKDVQDSILAEPRYADLVEVIDTKYWRYEAGGKLYAPPGGVNLAPRQHARIKQQKILITKGNQPSEKAAKAQQADDIQYWTVRDYREHYPQKAVIFSSDVAYVGWPAFMAGGSVCSLPGNLPKTFLETAVRCKPVDNLDPDRFWLLAGTNECLLYVKKGNTAEIDLTASKGTFKAQWIDARTGSAIGKVFKLTGGKVQSLPAQAQTILWLYQ